MPFCSVCLEPTGHYLACHHHICVKCISRNLKAIGNPIVGVGAYEMPCPECRRRNTILISPNVLSDFLCGLQAHQTVTGFTPIIFNDPAPAPAPAPANLPVIGAAVGAAEWESAGEYGPEGDDFTQSEEEHMDEIPDDTEDDDDQGLIMSDEAPPGVTFSYRSERPVNLD